MLALVVAPNKLGATKASKRTAEKRPYVKKKEEIAIATTPKINDEWESLMKEFLFRD